MPYLIMEPFLHVDTLLATSSVAFLLHREVSVHYQILVFSIAARNASIEILLLVSVPDSDSPGMKEEVRKSVRKQISI